MPSLATTNRFQQIDQKSLQTFMALSDLGLGHVRDYHGLKLMSILNVVILVTAIAAPKMMLTGFEEPPPRVPNLAPEHGSSTKPQGRQLEAEEKPIFEDLYALYDPSV